MTTALNTSAPPEKSTNGRSLALGAIRWGSRLAAPLAPELTTSALTDLFCTPRSRPLTRKQREVLASGQSFRVEHEGRYLDAWSFGRGSTVLLVHGWAGRGAQLLPLVAPLTALGHRVVLFDAPAHGQSEGRTTNLGDFSRAIASVLRTLGGAHGIIAHSMGGAATTIAISRYVRAPERLVFVAPPIHPSTWIRRFREMLELSDDIVERLTAEIERRARIPLDELHGDTIAREMKTPLLVIHDQGDREVPYASGERIAEAWPGARLITTEGLGHNRILRDPEVIHAATSFMRGEQ
jgi:pimeloyl-ACP methyl ester carboxylesterase